MVPFIDHSSAADLGITNFINMLMIIFYALQEGLANRSECFVIGLTISLYHLVLFKDRNRLPSAAIKANY
ncbi:hypothetical protein DMP75_09725 [Klebsiella michiganensis]|nr:hypothetical protein DMP75_09725 [Klebsiella michiganensis]